MPKYNTQEMLEQLERHLGKIPTYNIKRPKYKAKLPVNPEDLGYDKTTWREEHMRAVEHDMRLEDQTTNYFQ